MNELQRRLDLAIIPNKVIVKGETFALLSKNEMYMPFNLENK